MEMLDVTRKKCKWQIPILGEGAGAAWLAQLIWSVDVSNFKLVSKGGL